MYYQGRSAGRLASIDRFRMSPTPWWLCCEMAVVAAFADLMMASERLLSRNRSTQAVVQEGQLSTHARLCDRDSETMILALQMPQEFMLDYHTTF